MPTQYLQKEDFAAALHLASCTSDDATMRQKDGGGDDGNTRET